MVFLQELEPAAANGAGSPAALAHALSRNRSSWCPNQALRLGAKATLALWELSKRLAADRSFKMILAYFGRRAGTSNEKARASTASAEHRWQRKMCGPCNLHSPPRRKTGPYPSLAQRRSSSITTRSTGWNAWTRVNNPLKTYCIVAYSIAKTNMQTRAYYRICPLFGMLSQLSRWRTSSMRFDFHLLDTKKTKPENFANGSGARLLKLSLRGPTVTFRDLGRKKIADLITCTCTLQQSWMHMFKQNVANIHSKDAFSERSAKVFRDTLTFRTSKEDHKIYDSRTHKQQAFW